MTPPAPEVAPRLAVVCLTPQARDAAAHLARALDASLHLQVLVGPLEAASPFPRIADRIASLWNDHDGLVVFAPVGVVVRSIAPLVEHKTKDPGVVVVDALARWAIALVGGHEGGANRLAEHVANLLGSEPVVTTASEAVRDLVVGIGCRRGTPREDIDRAIDAALAFRSLDPGRVRLLATASPKRGEAGLRESAQARDLPLVVVHDLEIRSRRRIRSTAARRRVGLPAVSHPAALAAGRRTACLVKRFHLGPVLVSIAQERCGWWDSAPEPTATGPLRR